MAWWHWLVVAGLAVGGIWNHGWYGVVVVALVAGVAWLVWDENRPRRT